MRSIARGLPAGVSEADPGGKGVPRNPLPFSMLHRMRLVEQLGSGIRRIRDGRAEYGVAEPLIEVSPDGVTATFPRGGAGETPHDTPHVTPHVTPQVERLVRATQGEMRRAELMDALGLAGRNHFARNSLQPGIDAGRIEMTAPDRPRSRMQRYRLTMLGELLSDSRADCDHA